MARKRWQILDKWSWNLSDAGEEFSRAYRGVVAGSVVARWIQDRKQNFPGCQVRTFRRHVRAGGATLELVVGVVRREILTIAEIHGVPWVDEALRKSQGGAQ